MALYDNLQEVTFKSWFAQGGFVLMTNLKIAYTITHMTNAKI